MHGPEDDDRGQALGERHRERADRVAEQAQHVGPLAADEVADLAADQDERRRHQRLERDRRLHAADRRVEILDDRRDRHVHQRRVDDEHEHRHRQQDRQAWVARCLLQEGRLVLSRSQEHHPGMSVSGLRGSSVARDRCARSGTSHRLGPARGRGRARSAALFVGSEGRARTRPPPRRIVPTGRAARHGWRGTGGSRRDRVRRRRRAPRPGPSSSASATARLSATTGVGRSARAGRTARAPGASRSRQRSRASLCTALIAAWSWYGPGWLRRRQRRTSSWPSAISAAVPLLRSWSGSSTIVPSGAVRAARRDSVSSSSARRPSASGSSGMSSTRMRARRIASAHRSARTRSSPSDRGVALVEHEVDDGEHGLQPLGSSASPGTRYGILASRILRFARTRRFAIVASGTRNARAISESRARRAVAASVRSARRRERGMAAGEHEPQPVVGYVARPFRFLSRWSTSAAWAWRSLRDASRRSRSIARFRAVVVSQPPGFGGSPVAGHRSLATTNAS